MPQDYKEYKIKRDMVKKKEFKIPTPPITPNYEPTNETLRQWEVILGGNIEIDNTILPV